MPLEQSEVSRRHMTTLRHDLLAVVAWLRARSTYAPSCPRQSPKAGQACERVGQAVHPGCCKPQETGCQELCADAHAQ